MIKYLLLLPPCITQVLGVYVIKQWLLKIDRSAPLLSGLSEAALIHPVHLLTGCFLYGVSFLLLFTAIIKLPLTNFFPVFLGIYIIVGVSFGIIVGDGEVNRKAIAGIILILSGILFISTS